MRANSKRSLPMILASRLLVVVVLLVVVSALPGDGDLDLRLPLLLDRLDLHREVAGREDGDLFLAQRERQRSRAESVRDAVQRVRSLRRTGAALELEHLLIPHCRSSRPRPPESVAAGAIVT